MPTTLLLATRNRHKAAEIRAILGVECLTLDALPGAPALVEDADTFAGNAVRKAVQLAAWSRSAGFQPDASGIAGTMPSPQFSPVGRERENLGRLCVLADDSGLEVDALGGAPGVHSARFAALDQNASGNSSDLENNAKLLRLLANVPAAQRTARFRCVLALVQAHPPSSILHPLCFEGACEGHLRFTPSGKAGFGYDPLFVPEGFTESFAELGEAVKNRLSHRARALAKLRAWLQENP
jgi:XTP/dITP diphosphohydrolase